MLADVVHWDLRTLFHTKANGNVRVAIHQSVEPFPILSREALDHDLLSFLSAHFLNVLKRDSVSLISNINVYSDLCTHPPLFAFPLRFYRLEGFVVAYPPFSLSLFLFRKITDCLRVTYSANYYSYYPLKMSFFLPFSFFFYFIFREFTVYLNFKRPFVKIRDQI